MCGFAWFCIGGREGATLVVFTWADLSGCGGFEANDELEVDRFDMFGFTSPNSGLRWRSSLFNFTYMQDLVINNDRGMESLTGSTLILMTSDAYDLSYKQFPSTFPKLRRARFSPSVTASFLH